jgi:uncharacterized membrane protein YesL
MREQAEKWASFVLANLLWVLFAVFVITLPAATAGTFATISEQTRGKEVHFFEVFFGTMRRLWLKATAVGLLNLLLGGLIVTNLWIFGRMGTLDVMAFVARSVTLFVGLALLLTNLYIWPLMVLSDLPLRELVETSYKLMFAHPLRSLGVLIVAVIPVIVSFLLPRAAFLLVTVSSCIWIINWGTWPIIRQHIPETALTYL